jgi:hypothetical protein
MPCQFKGAEDWLVSGFNYVFVLDGDLKKEKAIAAFSEKAFFS